LARVREFTEADSEWLVFRISLALSSKPVEVALDSAATEAQRVEARQTALKGLDAQAGRPDVYSAGLSALVEILSDGRARAKGSRTPDSPLELIDPVEFTRVRLVQVYAVHKKTGTIAWYDIRVSAQDLLKIRRAIGEAASRPSADGDEEAPAGDRPQSRLEYLGRLELLVATLGHKFDDMSDSGVARKFVDLCKMNLRAGKLAWKLPQRRHIETRVKKIRADRLAAAANKTDRSDA